MATVSRFLEEAQIGSAITSASWYVSIEICMDQDFFFFFFFDFMNALECEIERLSVVVGIYLLCVLVVVDLTG